MYLRADVIAQPLVHQWYALPDRIAPVSACRRLAMQQTGLMRSFVKAPNVHVAATRRAGIQSDRFVGLPLAARGWAANWLSEVTTQRGAMLAFSDALQRLEALLREAEGGALDELYQRLPDALAGLVELHYDARHHPGYRVLEALTYGGELDSAAFQAVALERVTCDTRPHVMTTPLLDGPSRLVVRRPFRDPAWDELFRARREPVSIAWLDEFFGGTPKAAWSTLFSAETPPATPGVEDGLRLLAFGHASVMLRTPRAAVLFDPWIPPLLEVSDGRVSFDHLPDRLDAVCITHGHADHLMLESLLQLRHRTEVVVVPQGLGGRPHDPDLRLLLRSLGFPQVLALPPLEPLRVGDLELCAVPFLGEHADLDVTAKCGYLVRHPSRSVLVAADARAVSQPLYRRLRERLGPVDTLCVGLACEGAPLSWLYGDFLATPVTPEQEQTRRLAGCDEEEAMAMAVALGAREILAYAMGREPWTHFLTGHPNPEHSPPMAATARLIEQWRSGGGTADLLEAGSTRVYS